MKNLVIVESPAKAKTIEKFLGKDFVVQSSFGHIRDLSKKGISVDIENNFEPSYEIPDDKKKVITELRKYVKKAETVWLASDEDREGEAISWHLSEALNLDPKKTKRIVFHEITKPAIVKAVENPRAIDTNRVNAQQARRVLDRLVGYELSPILWKKVKPSLSAGRVQSVAVRLIVEREKEIKEFTPESAFKVTAVFYPEGSDQALTFTADLPERLKTVDEVKSLLQECIGAEFTVESLEKKPAKKSPAAPFTTSTLQQEASRKLGYSVSKTMLLAQRLYEAGKITYMRTDSVSLSNTALAAAAQEIEGRYGKEYAQTRAYKTKAKGAQEAHEAIRPTNLAADHVGGDSSESKLYELIWKRTIASQMSDAQLEKTTAKITISNSERYFVAKGEIVTFDGFLKVYFESTDDESGNKTFSFGDDKVLPPLKVDETLELEEIMATERFTRYPPRYTEASLVKKLEELGIGRPSTYAPTISTIQKRGYVEKKDKEGSPRDYQVITLKNEAISEGKQTENTGAEKAKLFPTDVGIVVNDFLMKHFEKIMDYHFTATVEEEFDEIARGEREWHHMIQEFYGPFHGNVEYTLEHAERASGERVLGEDPKTGKPVIARIGRYGAMIQIGTKDDEEKPRFTSLRADQSIETITFEEAMDLFKLPRTLGEYEGEQVDAAIGRFGPYVRWGSLFASLKKTEGDDPYTIKLDRAIELIEAKKKAEKEKYIKTFDEREDVQVLKGRYGPYIKVGKQNVRIPKDKEPKDLTLEECLQLAEESKNKPKRGRRTRKKKG